MTRTDRVKRVDPAQADRYAEIGRQLLHAGRWLREQGDPRHATALAIVAIHAVIALVDAACISRGGRKSTSADHQAALGLLRSILGNRLPAAMEREIGRVVAEKDWVEYQGYAIGQRDAVALLQRAERVGAWVEEVLAG